AASLIAARLHAQPSAGEPPEKAKARTLLKEGVRLLDARQLGPALRKFEDAYAAFPSAKILINVGTAQNALGRWADAANTYQRYLDSGADDAAQLPAVTAALAELDTRLGRLALKVRGAGRSTSELRIVGRSASEPRTASRGWMPLPPSGVVRVAPGRFEVQVRAGAGGREVNASGTIAAREQREVIVELAAQDPVRDAAPDPSGGSVDRTAPAPGTRPDDRAASAPGVEPADRTTAAPTPTVAVDAMSVAGSERRAPGESSSRRSRWTPLRQGAVVAGAIGGAGLIAMSVLALDARSMWNHAQPEKDLELARRAATRANLATGAGVLGAAALGTGIILWFVGAPRDREPPAVTAIVDGNHVGLAVQGAF
ncbi:MAG TPA: hypothetical protein VLM79_25155, partial [Kofleriaceae bacterium]|nr:hypothetical protein [Kofleriaceae bacterium]